MKQRIAQVVILVKDYDDAIDFYINKLDFKLLEDTQISEVKRWVVIAPPGAKECCLLLAKAKNEEEMKHIGNQTGGRVFLFLFTDDFDRDYKKYKERNIKFIRERQEMDFGMVAVFEDLYGNKWDFIQPNDNNKSLLSPL